MGLKINIYILNHFKCKLYVCHFEKLDMRIAVVFTLLLGWAYTSFSQQDFLIDTLEVNALRVPLKINETGRSISVIGSREIQNMAASSLDEILQTIVGVELQSRAGFGVQGDILMRGSTFTQVLVLIDGVKLNDPLTGHFNSYIPITTSEIERIEVLRGPASSIYGADAVGGVINIITKTFSNSENKTGSNGNFAYGSNKLVDLEHGFYIRQNKLKIGGGINYKQSEGELIPETIIDSSITLDAYYNFFDLKTIGLSFAYALNNSLKIKARTSFDHRDFGARYFYTTSTFDKSVETVSNYWNYLQLEKTTGTSVTDLNLSYKYNTDRFEFSPDFPSANEHLSQYYNVTLNHLRTLSDNLTIKVGTQVDLRKIESNDRGNHSDLHYGVYAMGVYRKNSLNFSLSIRGDQDNNYGFKATPSFNVSYVLPSITFRASVGSSIRAADYTERFVSNNLENLTPGRSLGNPNLQAETGWSEEIGIDFSPQKNWKISVTAFARQSDNLIDYASKSESEIGSLVGNGSLQPGESYFFAQNISNVNTQGIEVESNLRLSINKNTYLNWVIGYTAQNTSNEDDVISVYISSHAKHLVNTRLMFKKNKFSISLNGVYKNRDQLFAPSIDQELDGSYLLWNTKIGVQLMDQIGIHFTVRNILDEKYQNVLGAQMPGRWLLGGVNWSF